MDSNIVITISREYGSGGLHIGQKLADALQIPFYTRDDIEQKSKQEPILNEANCDWLKANRLRASNLTGAAFAVGGYGDITSQLFLKEANVVWKLAQSPCVLVGRCADFVLKNRPHTYRLFLSSGMPDRLRQIRENPKLYDAAVKREAKDILQMDKKRASYYQYYTGQIWGKASNYDLCVDTGKLGPQTVDLILEFVRRAEAICEPLPQD